MKHFYPLLICFLVRIADVQAQCTPAANDNCANAEVLVVDGGTVGGNSCGTLEPGELKDCASTATSSVWYSFVATASTLYVAVASPGGGCFVSSAIWEGTDGCPVTTGGCHALSCQSATGGPTTAVHRLDNLTNGATYRIQILYTAGACGTNINFNVGVTSFQPAGTLTNGPRILDCSTTTRQVAMFTTPPTSANQVFNQLPAITPQPTSANSANEVYRGCFEFTPQNSGVVSSYGLAVSYSIFNPCNSIWNWVYSELMDDNCNRLACGSPSSVPLICGRKYKLCLTFEIQSGSCVYNGMRPYVVIVPKPMKTWVGSDTTASSATICSGDSIRLNASGLGFSRYYWTPSSTLTSDSGAQVTAFPTSNVTYTVYGYDSAGCFQTKTVQVNVAPKPTPTVTPSNATLSCVAPNATLTATGGASYTWSTGATGASITTNTPGTYTVTASNGGGCTATASAVVDQNSSQPVATITPTSAALDCDVTSVTLTAGGGVTYSWSTGATGNAINITTGGSYMVTVTDATGCAANTSVSVTQNNIPPTASINPSGGLLNCITTSITYYATGGGNYSWSTSSTSDSIVVTTPGTYQVTVTDPANGCTATAAQTVTQNITAPNVSINPPVDLTCSITNVNVVASSTTVNASFDWGGGNTGSTLNVTTAGPYSVTVTDPANGCTAQAGVTVNFTPSLVTSFIPSAALCNGSSTGALDLTISGGQSPYVFEWSNQASTEDISFVAAGSYTVTITDNGGCSITASATVSEPAAMIVSGTPVNVTCNGANDGSISCTATGGSSPYSYMWNDNVTTAGRTNLSPGTFSVTVTDANQCTGTATASISEAAPIELFDAHVDVSCNHGTDGSIDITARGGSQPFSYKWNDNATSEDRNQIPAGTYDITVTDMANCTMTASIPVSEPTALQFSQQVNNPTCPENGGDGDVVVTPSGATPPYTYSWSNGRSTPDNSGLNSGSYTVTVTDANSCIVTISFNLSYKYQFTIEASPAVSSIEPGQTVTLNYQMDGIAGNTTQKWTPGGSLSCDNCQTTVASPAETTTYQVEVTNDDGCKATDAVVVYVNPGFSLYVPNSFTPNADGFNDFFEIYGDRDGLAYLQMQVFNRWGEKVYESNDHYFKWDGSYKGEPLVTQALTWQLLLGFEDGHVEKLRKGSLTLLK